MAQVLERRVMLTVQPVISEFMASNSSVIHDAAGDYDDWIEIHNPNTTSLNIGGYYLTDNASKKTKWQFPANTTIAADGYLLVWADSSATSVVGTELHANFNLGAAGEYLGLIQPDGVSVAYEYAPQFPAQEQNVSYGIPGNVETDVLISPGATTRYLVGTGSSFPTGYQNVSFNDSSWSSGPQPVGFGSQYTSILGSNVASAMQQKHTAAIMRVPFTMASTSGLTSLNLKMNYDDGFVAYLNGTQVLSVNAPSGTLTPNSKSTSGHSALGYETFNLNSRLGLLTAGANELVIVGLNGSTGSTDYFLMASELDATRTVNTTNAPTPGFLPTPTPGAANVASTLNSGPAIDDVTPGDVTTLAANQALTVTALVTQNLAPVASVKLDYRAQYGADAQLTMFDDGAHGDGAAGDGVYGATIPASASATPGQMLRWYVQATDTAGNTSRAPIHAGDASAIYYGTVVINPAETSPIPIFQIFAAPGDIANLTTDTGARASVYYNGEFYDNVLVKHRGNNTTLGVRVDFNKDDLFLWRSDGVRVDSIDLNYGSNEDESNIRALLSFQAFRDAGVPAIYTAAWRMDLNGAFWKETTFLEVPDGNYLERVGLDPDGDLYKVLSDGLRTASGANDTNYELDNGDDGSLADVQAMLTGIHQPTATARANYIYDNFDVEEVINYWAVNTVINDEDDVSKNFYLYRDSDTGKWMVLPWDKDLTFGKNYFIADYQSVDPQTHPFFGNSAHYKIDGPGEYNYLWDQFLAVPAIKQMYLRRLRSVMDQELQAPGTAAPGLYFDNEINAFSNTFSADANIVAYLGGAAAMATAFNNIKTKYLTVRRNHLYVDHSTNTSYPDFAGIPQSQAGSPTINVGAIDYDPASGNQGEEYIRLDNPNSAAADISGWTLSNAVDFTFEPGTVIPAGGSLYVTANFAAFKARATGPSGGQGLLLAGDYSGGLSSAGETITLSDAGGHVVTSYAYQGTTSAYASSLRITEVMYDPAPDATGAYDHDEYEYLELENVSGATINLGGLAFTQGIALTFGGDVNLAPGEYGVVVRDAAAFQARYGTSPRILGAYTGKLDNSGERIRLEDTSGYEIADFSYAATWQPSTVGQGYSLVKIDPTADISTYGVASAWAASRFSGGSPGAAEPQPGVVSRNVVYRGSYFDGNATTLGAADDAAIATDKVALRAGQTATFANYTSYSKGINGIVVDLSNLTPAQIAALSLADFSFAVGNTSSVSTWTAAPPPTGILVRAGAGAGGSTRVEIAWADGVISGEWLEVSVLADAATGLASRDVFYFGNAPGESGNSPTDAVVDSADEAAARNNPRTFASKAPITFAYDYNRDGLVNAADQLVARNAATTLAASLKLISVPPPPSSPSPMLRSFPPSAVPLAAPPSFDSPPPPISALLFGGDEDIFS